MGDRGLQQQEVAHDHVHEVAGVAPGEVAQRKPAQLLRQVGPTPGRGPVGVPVAGLVGRDLRYEHHEHPDEQKRGEPPQLHHIRRAAGRPGREHGANHLDGDSERNDVHQIGDDRVEDRLAQFFGMPHGNGPKHALHATPSFVSLPSVFLPSLQLSAPT